METVDTSLNIETPIFKNFKKYLQDKSNFSPKVFNDTPKNLTVFPTVVFKETNNTQNNQGTTLDRIETVDNISFVIELYAKDMVVNDIQYTKKQIVNELKNLTYIFFQAYGCERTQSSDADYLDWEVKRHIIIESCSLNSWNKKINL